MFNNNITNIIFLGFIPNNLTKEYVTPNEYNANIDSIVLNSILFFNNNITNSSRLDNNKRSDNPANFK
ncbi:MAG: hypothetical protein Q8O87_04225 [bacterium]|nr:hypothetical protein [bacterium]